MPVPIHIDGTLVDRIDDNIYEMFIISAVNLSPCHGHCVLHKVLHVFDI